MHSKTSGKPLQAMALRAGLASMALCAASAQAAQYTVTDVGLLSPDLHMQATGLNASGQVIGYAYGGQYTLGNISFSIGNTGELAFVTGANGQGLTALPKLTGDTWVRASGINDAGQVVGTSGNYQNESSHAFITTQSSSEVRNLGSLGGTLTSANAINASGQVVGSSTDASGAKHGYITGPQGGAMQQLNTAEPSPNVRVTGINASGQVAGDMGSYYQAPRGSFVSGPQGAPIRYISDDRGDLFTVNGINDRGQTVGNRAYYVGGSGNAFLRDADGTVTMLDLSQAPHYLAGNMGRFGQYGANTSTYAEGVNGLGQVVGTIVRNDLNAGGQQSYAFVTGANGTNAMEVGSLDFVNFTVSPDFYFRSATGINDLGSFVANGSDGHAYLITSVPEPATALTLLCGLLPIAGLAKARRQRNSDRT